MAAEWFYQAKGQQLGPVVSAELRRLADAGTITPDTLVCIATATGMADGRWVRAAKVQGLFHGSDTPHTTAVRQKELRSPPSPLPPPIPPVLSDSPRLLRLVVALAAGGTVTVALLAAILLLHHNGKEVVSDPTSQQVPVAQGAGDNIDWEKKLAHVPVVAPPAGRQASGAIPPPPDGSGIVPVQPQQPAPSSPSPSPKDTDTVVLSDNSVYEKTVPSVVIIRSFRGTTPFGVGSGFVLDPGDRIVTNEHVIHGASIVEVHTHKGEFSNVMRVMAVDEDRDIAVLPMPQALAGMPGLRLADAPPKVGDPVFALGSPLGLKFTFTKGIVSQFRRNFGLYGSVVQTDVSLSPGSSGSPLVDRHGQVVGVNTLASRAVAEAHNLNFAVSAEEIAAVCKRQKPCALSELKSYLEYEPEKANQENSAQLTSAQLVEKVIPSIVQFNIGNKFLGSGFVVDAEKGLIATNYHVIKGVKKATVVFKDKKSYPVEGFVAILPGEDLALIHIKPDSKILKALKLAESLPVQGDPVVAFGSPLRPSDTVTSGIVRLVRSGEELHKLLMRGERDFYKDVLGYNVNLTWIQTSTPISPGNSGGPLVNAKGEIVGLNTFALVHAGGQGQNLNFAVSAIHLKKLLAGAGNTGAAGDQPAHKRF